MPAYASSSQEPDGLMVSAIQQKYAATEGEQGRDRRAPGVGSRGIRPGGDA